MILLKLFLNVFLPKRCPHSYAVMRDGVPNCSVRCWAQVRAELSPAEPLSISRPWVRRWAVPVRGIALPFMLMGFTAGQLKTSRHAWLFYVSKFLHSLLGAMWSQMEGEASHKVKNERNEHTLLKYVIQKMQEEENDFIFLYWILTW